MSRADFTEWWTWLWFDPIGILFYGVGMIAVGIVVLWLMGRASRRRIIRRYQQAEANRA